MNVGAHLLCTSDGVCVGQIRGGGTSPHSGIEFGQSRTSEGSSGDLYTYVHPPA
jgi:hypothetical protein